ncbi:MAG: DUF1624 domain-containing protein [Oligoflexia bacterium]|nr:DUF1624 domain-containing protein [Oligoflexia bacterium]
MADAGPGRSVELDAMRTLALILMAASHVTRIVLGSARGWWCAPSLLLDPLTQGMFMGLVGASLAWSWSNAQRRGTQRGPWLRARARRALEIYLVGVLLFLFDKGTQIPWLFVAPGILADIALAIVVYSVTASSRRPVLWTLVLSLCGYGLMAWLEWPGVDLFVAPVNAGNAPLLPNVALSGFGLLAGLGLVRRDRWLLGGLAVPSLLGAAAMLSQHSFSQLLGDELGRTFSSVTYVGGHDGLSNTWAMLTGGTLVPDRVEYFTPSLASQPLVLGSLVAIYLAFRVLRPVLNRLSETVLLPGRYSLGAYVFHLALVGLPVVIIGRAKPLRSAVAGNISMVLILVGIFGYSAVREWQTRRRRRRRRRQAAPVVSPGHST